jgi:hypothetical protein
VTNESRLHEKQPGALIFRRGSNDSRGLHVALQVVLLVLETPTSGIHQTAMVNALKFVGRWQPEHTESKCPADTSEAIRRNIPRDIRIIGPGFSGSTVSLARALKLSKICPDRFTIVSGSATADANACILGSILPRAAYHTTVQTTSRELAALDRTLTKLNPAWAGGGHTALLIESKTSYGDEAGQLNKKPQDNKPDNNKPDNAPMAPVDTDQRQYCHALQQQDQRQDRRGPFRPFAGALVFRFPLHVAELRTEAASPTPTLSLMPASAVPLSLRETTPPADQIPELRPGLNSPVVESQVNSILDTIRHERITLVGIVATDERDTLFLARAIKREAPDVQLFFIGANLLYLHSDYVPYTRGALVASTYPLYLSGQRPLDDPDNERSAKLDDPDNKRSPQRREAFQSMVAEGVFNATLVQIDKPDKLSDYCVGDTQCRPPFTPPTEFKWGSRSGCERSVRRQSMYLVSATGRPCAYSRGLRHTTP